MADHKQALVSTELVDCVRHKGKRMLAHDCDITVLGYKIVEFMAADRGKINLNDHFSFNYEQSESCSFCSLIWNTSKS